MKNSLLIIAIGIAGAITFGTKVVAEKHYQDAIQYTVNVAESDGDIVWAMGQWGFEIESPFEDITDEDWATSISAWPHCVSLMLSNSAGRKAIGAASKLEELGILFLRNSELTESDLEPLRGHKKLTMLLVWKGKTVGPTENPYVAYLNQERTGRWQVDNAKRGN